MSDSTTDTTTYITCAQLADNIASALANDSSLQGLSIWRDKFTPSDDPEQQFPAAVITAESGAGIGRWTTDEITYTIGIVVATDPTLDGLDNTFDSVYDPIRKYSHPAVDSNVKSPEWWIHRIADILRDAPVGGVLTNLEYTLSQADSYPLHFVDATLTYTIYTSAFPA